MLTGVMQELQSEDRNFSIKIKQHKNLKFFEKNLVTYYLIRFHDTNANQIIPAICLIIWYQNR